MASAVGLSVTSSLGDIDPDVISTDVALAAQAELPWPRLIQWTPYSGPGLTHNIPGAASLAMTAKANSHATWGSDTDVSSTFDMNTRTITISMKGVDVNVYTESFLSGVVDPRVFITDSMRKAYIKKVDTDVMALYTESPTDVTGPLTYTAFLQAFEILAGQAADNPIAMVIPSTSFAAFWSIEEFKKANEFGKALLQQNVVLPAGYLGNVAGVECYWSNHYTASTGDHGIMFSQNAIRLVERMPFTIAIDATEEGVGNRGIRIGGTTMYGVAGTRGTSATTNPWIVDLVL